MHLSSLMSRPLIQTLLYSYFISNKLNKHFSKLTTQNWTIYKHLNRNISRQKSHASVSIFKTNTHMTLPIEYLYALNFLSNFRHVTQCSRAQRNRTRISLHISITSATIAAIIVKCVDKRKTYDFDNFNCLTITLFPYDILLFSFYINFISTVIKLNCTISICPLSNDRKCCKTPLEKIPANVRVRCQFPV